MTEHNNHPTKQLNQAIAGLGTATDNIATLQSQLNALTYSGRGDGDGDDGSGDGSRNSSSGGGAGTGTPEDKRHRFDFNREPKRKVYCHRMASTSPTDILAIRVLTQVLTTRRTQRALPLWDVVLENHQYAYDR